MYMDVLTSCALSVVISHVMHAKNTRTQVLHDRACAETGSLHYVTGYKSPSTNSVPDLRLR